MFSIPAFSVAVENGSFLLKGAAGGVDPSQQALFDEMTTFPVGEHDDLLDAAATGTAFLLDRREPRVCEDGHDSGSRRTVIQHLRSTPTSTPRMHDWELGSTRIGGISSLAGTKRTWPFSR